MQKNEIGRYAIFQTGGKQYQAIEGQTLSVEKLSGDIGQSVEFKEVLLRRTDENTVEVGRPFLESSVKCSILKQVKDKKILVFRFKRRKKSRVKKGHRQTKTLIKVESI